jgi:CRISPR/Cas system endoribonuclease Cas6 (RAMP superfamily)
MKWYRIDVTAVQGYKPPFFCGSMLRGVFSTALKRVTCVNPSYQCDGCFGQHHCIYYSFFEEKNSFHSYRISSRLGMEHLKFSIYLFEKSTDELPFVLSAIKRALEEVGLRKEREAVKIAQMHVNDQLVYNGKEFLSISAIEPHHFTLQKVYHDLTIHFNMPLRIKQHNQLAKRSISLPHLIINIHNRYRELKELPPQKLGFRVEGEITESKLRYLDLYRYSNRQKVRMKLGGIVGEITLRGVDEQSFYYLKLGEIIGAGKQTVFGLGDYEIKPLGEE